MPSNKKGLADLKAAFKEIQAEKARQAAVTPPVEATRQPAELLKDSKLFDRATRTVKPIQANARVIHPPATLQKPATALQRRQRAVGTATQATPLATSTAVSDGAGLYPASGDATDGNARFAAPGVGPDTVRKLRQAYWPVGAQLDLHGMTSTRASHPLPGNQSRVRYPLCEGDPWQRLWVQVWAARPQTARASLVNPNRDCSGVCYASRRPRRPRRAISAD